ncbi:MAG TPA: urea ABC transporter permease subunit UrtB [Stellaceae bacterium]|nr:urea ABC transporter permease subunit UrtB [Stellaceae bacterium]
MVVFRSIAFALLTLLALSQSALAAELAEILQPLASDDFDQKAAAIRALGASGDPNAIRILRALSDGNLYTVGGQSDDNGNTDNGSGSDSDNASTDSTSSDTTSSDATATASPKKPAQLVIGIENGGNCDTSDAVSGKKLGTVSCDSLDKVVINNRLRGIIDAALGGLTLFSDRRDDRLSAAQEALKHPGAERIQALEKAYAAEKDDEVRQVLGRAVAAAHLFSGDKSVVLGAIGKLADTSDPDIFSLLNERRDAPNLDPEVKAALDHAISGIAGRQRLIGVGATLFEGISLGSVLLLAAIGLAITFGVMGVINMAHGEMIMLGAYSAFVVQEAFRSFLPPGWFDAYLVAAVPVAFLAAGAVGVLLERTVIRFLYNRPLETMLATWGVSLILQQLVRTVFGAPNRQVSNPSWMTGGIDLIGGFTVTWNRLVIIVFCFAVLGALALLLRRTSFGLHMRAVTQNRDMAAVMGIPTARIDALTFGLGSGIAGIAGVALSQIGNVSPNLGTIYIVDSFLVVVFGGVGNLMGTLVGAMTLGIVNKILEPVAGAVLGKVVVLLAIILFIQKRPRGLFALRGRAAEN